MKKKKLIPFAFLGGLVIIVIFIFGVQYGKKVAEVDKTIKYLISITPTKAVTITPAPSITYTSLENEACGVSFLYPSNLSAVTSSQSGVLKNKKTKVAEFTCDKITSVSKGLDLSKTATASVTIDNKEIEASKSGDIYLFSVVGKKRQIVEFSVTSALLPLIEKTLKVAK